MAASYAPEGATWRPILPKPVATPCCASFVNEYRNSTWSDSLKEWSSLKLPTLWVSRTGKEPVDFASKLYVVRCIGKGCTSDGNGLSGDIVRYEASVWPSIARNGEPDRRSVLITSCCPAVG